MIEKSRSATIRTAFGKTLEKPLPYSWTWKEYKDEAEFLEAKAQLTTEEQMKVRNDAEEGKARSAASAKAVADAGIVRPTAENDTQVAMRDMLKPMLVARLPNGERKFTDEQARTIVESTFGEKFDE